MHGVHRALRQADWAVEREWLLIHERCGMNLGIITSAKGLGTEIMVIVMNVGRDMIVVDGVRLGSV